MSKNKKKDRSSDTSRGLADWASSWKVIIGAVSTLLVISIAGGVVLLQMQDLSIIVNPVVLPEELRAKGYDANSLAQQIAAELIRIQRTVEKQAKTDRLASQFVSLDGATNRKARIVEGHNLLDIKLLDQVPSIRKLARAVKELRGAPDMTVDVAIVNVSKSYKANTSVVGGWVGDRQNAETQPNLDIALLVREAAMESLWLIEPYVLTVYQKFVDDDACARNAADCRYVRTLELLERLDRGNPIGQAIPSEVQRRCWVLLAKSSVVMRLGKFEEVVALASEAVQLDAHFGPGYFNWVNALFGEKRYHEAAEVAQRWANIAPDDAEAYEYLGSALDRDGRSDAAIDAFRRSLAIDSNRPVVNVLWGNLLARQGDSREAGAKYSAAVAEQGRLGQPLEEAATLYQWGVMLSRVGDVQGAVEKLSRAVALNRQFPGAEEALARALVADGKPRDALAHFEQAQTSGELSAQGYRAWSMALSALGQRLEAAEKSQRARRLERQSSRP